MDLPEPDPAPDFADRPPEATDTFQDPFLDPAPDPVPDTAAELVIDVVTDPGTPDVPDPCLAIACDDLDPCTLDVCEQGVCLHVAAPDGTPCEDGNTCTTPDACLAGACAGGPNTCSCTMDLDCQSHEDGDLCNGTLRCLDHECVVDPATVIACPAPAAPCRRATCDPGTGLCGEGDAPDGEACDDGAFCTTLDRCRSGKCEGLARDCGDGVACTLDVCDEAGKTCTHVSNPAICDDANPCTDDECDVSAGMCAHVPNSAPCDDGDPCTSPDTCVSGACTGGPNVCACKTDPDCAAHEDGDRCNGTLRCRDHLCDVDPETVITCKAPADPCRQADCVPATGVCQEGNVPDGKACDDGRYCTDPDQCRSGTCDGLPRDCGDGVACTLDACDEKGKQCTHVTNYTACDDGNVCTDEGCDKATGLCTHVPNTRLLPCDDKDPCTEADRCWDGKCGGQKPGPTGDPCLVWVCDPASAKKWSQVPAADGTACEGYDPCMADGGWTCKAGVCTGKPKDCSFLDGPCRKAHCEPGLGCLPVDLENWIPCPDDGNPCTADLCLNGECFHQVRMQACDDGDPCTHGDLCSDSGCHGLPITCLQTNPCTDNTCDPKTGSCPYHPVADGLPCDDHNACSKQDACWTGVCSGVPLSCDDSNPCTHDLCDTITGCLNPGWPEGTPCTDDRNPCTADVCDGSGACVHRNDDTGVCDDNDRCTAGDHCVSGRCTGTPVVCDDGNPCTPDYCDWLQGCVTGWANQCDDKNPCTDDSCASPTTCLHVPNSAPCEDGTLCTGPDACSGGTCVGGPNHCQCMNDADCKPFEDGNPCNGTLKCYANACVVDPPTVIHCNPSTKPCVVNACVPATGKCTEQPTDGVSCTANCFKKGTCSAGACVGSDPVSCDDGNPCTRDSCHPASGTCVFEFGGGTCPDDGNPCTDDRCDWHLVACIHPPNNAPCDDQDPCTYADRCVYGTCAGFPGVSCDDKDPCTVDTCVPGVGCAHAKGTGPCADDGNPCTDDVCDAETGKCSHVPNAASCDDADRCTVATYCSGGTCGGGCRCQADGGSAEVSDSFLPGDLSPDRTVAEAWQSLKAPARGQWTTLEVHVAAGSGRVTIRRGEGVSGPVLGTEAYDWTYDPPARIDLGRPIPVEAGATYTFVLEPDAGSTEVLAGGPYADGTSSLGPDLDLSFVAGFQTCGPVTSCDAGTRTVFLAACADDANPCTRDVCDPKAGCLHASTPGAACDDFNPCSTAHLCVGSKCTATATIDCDDANPCTADSCDPASGICRHTPAAGPCSDGQACTLTESCMNGVCGGCPCTAAGAPVADQAMTESMSASIYPGSFSIWQSFTPGKRGRLSALEIALGTKAAQPSNALLEIYDGEGVAGTRLASQAIVLPVVGPSGFPGLAKHELAVPVGLSTGRKATFRVSGSGYDVVAIRVGGDPYPLGTSQDSGNDLGFRTWMAACAETPACATDPTALPSLLAPSLCNDGNACTIDSCQSGIGCVFTPRAGACADDDNPCTLDTCDPVTGACTHPAVQDAAPCASDGNPCTLDQCVPGKGTCSHEPGGTSDPCETDFNPCTDDRCDPATGACGHVPNEAACDDGNACTTGDACRNGVCAGTGQVTCSAPCAVSWCDPATGCRQAWAIGDPCDDHNACTTADTCGLGGCAGGPPTDCDDSNPCTQDSCNPKSGCKHVAVPAACDDGDLCNGPDGCVNGACVNVGPAVDCDDHNACTGDACSNAERRCTHTWIGTACDDKDACTTGDVLDCTTGKCVGNPRNCNDSDACTLDSCNPATGCVHARDPAACGCGDPDPGCDDSDACTVDSCDPATHRCVHAAKVCDDRNTCTDDTCDKTRGCTYTPNTAPCNDRSACTLGETCGGGTCGGGACACTPGPTPATDAAQPLSDATRDGIDHWQTFTATTRGAFAALDLGPGSPLGTASSPAVLRLYDGEGLSGALLLSQDVTIAPDPTSPYAQEWKLSGMIAAVPGHRYTFRVTVPTSDDAWWPVATGNPYAGGGYLGKSNEDTAFRVRIAPCTETGACVKDPAKTTLLRLPCDDGNPCTSDSCDPLSGCRHFPQGGPCPDDGNACTTDFCNAATGVCAHSPSQSIHCASDGNPCTSDECDPATGACVHRGRSGPCEDDLNPCTSDVCDPITLKCLHLPADVPCDDGNACTVDDRCVAGTCKGGYPLLDCSDHNPCTDDACDPKTLACGHTFNVAPCDDGDACTWADTCHQGTCGHGCRCALGKARDIAQEQGLKAGLRGGKVSWQTFTADRRGGLTAVSIGMRSPVAAGASPATLEILRGDGATGVPIWSQAVTLASGPAGWKALALTRPVPLVPGTQYAWRLTVPATDQTFLEYTWTNPYKPGRADSGTQDDYRFRLEVASCLVESSCTSDPTLPTVLADGCDDGEPCTDDACAPSNGSCGHVANVAACDDHNPCTTGDACASGVCVPGKPEACDDGLACTADTCDVGSGCVHTPLDALCDDGVPCTVDRCDPTQACIHTPASDTLPCDDGNPCTVTDTCANGKCGGGCLCTPSDGTIALVDLSPYHASPAYVHSSWPYKDFWQTFVPQRRGLLQTVDLVLQTMTTTPATLRVYEGQGIQGPLLSSVQVSFSKLFYQWQSFNLSVPVPVAPNRTYTLRITVDTNYWGTVEVAYQDVYAEGGFGFEKNWPEGQDLVFRMGLTPCLETGGCVDDPALPTLVGLSCSDHDPCTDDACNPAGGTCGHTFNTAACDDGDACTESDRCSLGKCVPGAAPDCDDLVACTKDSCDPKVGCVHEPDDAACVDTDPCTVDTCGQSGCLHPRAAEESFCDDSNACTLSERCIGGVCGGGCTCTPGAAKAGPVNDQTNVPNDLKNFSHERNTVWQSFRAGVRGGLKRLSAFGAAYQVTGTVQVFEGTGIGGRVLGTSTLAFPAHSPYSWADAVFEPPVPVEPGRTYTWACSRPAGSYFILQGVYGNPYPDGITEIESFAPSKGGGKPDWLFRVWLGPCKETGGCVLDPAQPTRLVPDCDDTNVCTADSCDPAKGCVHANVPGPCEDGKPCTGPDTCAGGTCASGPAVDCDDSFACTLDWCDPATGCVHLPRDILCDDANVCTTDTCDVKAGCVHPPVGANVPCDDRSACSLGDHCSGTGACTPGAAIDCDDQDLCTTDSCAAATGCAHDRTSNRCDDGNSCTLDRCGAGNDCFHDALPKTTPCGKPADACKAADHCDGAGACVGGTLTDCEDQNACTIDSCDPAKGCIHTKVSSECDDGNACTDDRCDVVKGCLHDPSGPKACDDGSACTVGESCGAGTCGGCRCSPSDQTAILVDQPNYNTGIGRRLDFWQSFRSDRRGMLSAVDLQFINPSPLKAEIRVYEGVISDTGEPYGVWLATAPVTIASGMAGEWHTYPFPSRPWVAPGRTYTVRVVVDRDNGFTVLFSDQDPYPGYRLGLSGTYAYSNWDLAFRTRIAPCTETAACVTDPASSTLGIVTCSDLDPCTDDACTPADGSCTHTFNVAPCDDGKPCTIGDVCSAGKCAGSKPNPCDDAIACTRDSCDPAQGCVHVPDPKPCGDSNPCTDDVCSPVKGCVHNPGSEGGSCNDHAACTPVDRCHDGLCGAGCTCTVPGYIVQDQAVDTIPSAFTNLSSNNDFGQSFRIARRGRLSRLDFLPICGDLTGATLRIYRGSGYDSTPIVEQALSKPIVVDCYKAQLPGTNNYYANHDWFSMQILKPVPVDPEEVLTFRVTTGPGKWATPLFWLFDAYGRGRSFHQAPVDGWYGWPGYDYGFRAWVAPCDETGGCIEDPSEPTVLVGCDDGNGCTLPHCDPATGACNPAARTLSCPTDDVACTVDECDPVYGCVHRPIDSVCEDGNACTLDRCDPVDGCVHSWAADGMPCSDGLNCTSGDVCFHGVCGRTSCACTLAKKPSPDQSASQPDDYEFGYPWFLQTFTAGRRGALTRLTLGVASDNGAQWAELLVFDGEGPYGKLLHKQQFKVPGTPPGSSAADAMATTFDLPPVPMVPGRKYTLALRSPDGGLPQFVVQTNSKNPYSRGRFGLSYVSSLDELKLNKQIGWADGTDLRFTTHVASCLESLECTSASNVPTLLMSDCTFNPCTDPKKCTDTDPCTVDRCDPFDGCSNVEKYSNCCRQHASTGCEEPACLACVCTLAPGCCITDGKWHAGCVAIVAGKCADSCTCTGMDCVPSGIDCATDEDCDDGIACTADRCNGTAVCQPTATGGQNCVFAGVCEHEPADGLCEDRPCQTGTCTLSGCAYLPTLSSNGQTCIADPCNTGTCAGGACTGATPMPLAHGPCAKTDPVCPEDLECVHGTCERPCFLVPLKADEIAICGPGGQCTATTRCSPSELLLGDWCYTPNVCGNRLCEPGEDSRNCPDDCFATCYGSAELCKRKPLDVSFAATKRSYASLMYPLYLEIGFDSRFIDSVVAGLTLFGKIPMLPGVLDTLLFAAQVAMEVVQQLLTPTLHSQEMTIHDQLAIGIRVLDLDLMYCYSGLMAPQELASTDETAVWLALAEAGLSEFPAPGSLCFCDFGSTGLDLPGSGCGNGFVSAAGVLDEISRFLSENPSEVVFLDLEASPAVAPDEVRELFSQAGLLEREYTPPASGPAFPYTMNDMARLGKRLVVFGPGFLDPKKYVFRAGHTYSQGSDTLKTYCKTDAVPGPDQFYITEHVWVNPKFGMSDPHVARCVNGGGSLPKYATQCRNETGHRVNAMPVDFMLLDDCDVLRAAETLNGVSLGSAVNYELCGLDFDSMLDTFLDATGAKTDGYYLQKSMLAAKVLKTFKDLIAGGMKNGIAGALKGGSLGLTKLAWWGLKALTGSCGFGCATGIPCPHGEVCHSFMCGPPFPVGAPCFSGTDCESNHCAGICVECTSNDHCGKDEFCFIGACVSKAPVGSPCFADVMCQTDRCSGICVECRTDGDCGKDEFCVMGVDCVQKWPSGAPCVYNGMCQSGHCSGICVDCHGDGDCPSDEFCVLGGFGGCRSKWPNGAPCGYDGMCASDICCVWVVYPACSAWCFY